MNEEDLDFIFKELSSRKFMQLRLRGEIRDKVLRFGSWGGNPSYLDIHKVGAISRWHTVTHFDEDEDAVPRQTVTLVRLIPSTMQAWIQRERPDFLLAEEGSEVTITLDVPTCEVLATFRIVTVETTSLRHRRAKTISTVAAASAPADAAPASRREITANAAAKTRLTVWLKNKNGTLAELATVFDWTIPALHAWLKSEQSLVDVVRLKNLMEAWQNYARNKQERKENRRVVRFTSRTDRLAAELFLPDDKPGV